MQIDPNVQIAIVGLLGTIWTGSLGVFTVWLKRQGSRLHEVHEQVKNTHESNLRDDVDSLRDDVAAMLSGLKRVITELTELRKQQSAENAALRDELKFERAERIDVSRRLDALIKEIHDARS